LTGGNNATAATATCGANIVVARYGYGQTQTVSNMSKYNILEQTGMAALAEANSNEQAVLTLLR
jgi:hypothetical protein